MPLHQNVALTLALVATLPQVLGEIRHRGRAARPRVSQVFVKSSDNNRLGGGTDYAPALGLLGMSSVTLGNFIQASADELVLDLIEPQPAWGPRARRLGHQRN